MGHALGIVSRSDLIPKQEAAEGPGPEAWQLLSKRGRKAHARHEAATAARLMSTSLVTVGPDESVARAAYLMQRRAVTHLPVVDDRGVVIGIVSRSDLLGIFLRGDAEIREDVIRDVVIEALDADRDTIDVNVEGGIVTLSGNLDHASAAAYAVRSTRSVPGVVDVVDKLHGRHDESAAGGPGRAGPPR
jgi:CBS domain-containing protein